MWDRPKWCHSKNLLYVFCVASQCICGHISVVDLLLVQCESLWRNTKHSHLDPRRPPYFSNLKTLNWHITTLCQHLSERHTFIIMTNTRKLMVCDSKQQNESSLKAFFLSFLLKKTCFLSDYFDWSWCLKCSLCFQSEKTVFSAFACRRQKKREIFTLKKNMWKDMRWNKKRLLSERDERRWSVLVSMWFRVWTEPLWVPADQRKQTSHRRRRTERRSCREFISPEGKIKLKRILQHCPQRTSDLIIIYLTPSSSNYIFSLLHLLVT